MAPLVAQSYTVAVIDNTIGSTILSCSITAGNVFCRDTSAVAVTAGHYLQVQITNVGVATSNRPFRVSFRY